MNILSIALIGVGLLLYCYAKIRRNANEISEDFHNAIRKKLKKERDKK